jgi:hypothetical protein
METDKMGLKQTTTFGWELKLIIFQRDHLFLFAVGDYYSLVGSFKQILWEIQNKCIKKIQIL